MFWIIGIYLLIGLIVSIIAILKEPILIYALILLPIGILIWPWVLWVVILFPDNTGRWI